MSKENCEVAVKLIGINGREVLPEELATWLDAAEARGRAEAEIGVRCEMGRHMRDRTEAERAVLEVLEAHRRFHRTVGCPGRPECCVCAEEEWFLQRGAGEGER